jgi:hypothetical protein
VFPTHANQTPAAALKAVAFVASAKDTSEATDPCTALAAPAMKKTATIVGAALRRAYPRGSYDFLPATPRAHAHDQAGGRLQVRQANLRIG